MYKNILSVIILALFIPLTSYCAEFNNDTNSDKENSKEEKIKIPLEISDVWARKSMSSANNSAAYMKINNPTNKQITIIGASASEIANNVELHKSFVDEKGISRMTAIDNIVIPPQSEIELKPGGIHIMLFDLKQYLQIGEKFTLTIKIENHKPIKVESNVR